MKDMNGKLNDSNQTTLFLFDVDKSIISANLQSSDLQQPLLIQPQRLESERVYLFPVGCCRAGESWTGGSLAPDLSV